MRRAISKHTSLFQNFSRCISEGAEISSKKSSYIRQPPNLKIYSNALSSPFYGMEKIVNEKKSTEEPLNEEEKLLDSSSKEEEDIFYDPAGKPDSTVYAIPLPKRLKVSILDFATSEEVGTIHLSDSVFGQDPIRSDILHRVVIYQRNKKRGKRLAKTKNISATRGSTRKVRPQKGTGRARAGHGRPPHWKGGAVAHGPKGTIQDYTTKLNKKVRKLGLKMAFSQKLKEGNLIVTGNLKLPTFKTRSFAQILKKHYNIAGEYGSTAFILDHVEPEEKNSDEEKEAFSLYEVDANLHVASRNLYKVKVCNALYANVYDILKHEKLIISLASLQAIEERLSK